MIKDVKAKIQSKDAFNKQLEDINKKLKEEQEKINKIIEIDKNIENNKNEMTEIKSNIFNFMANYEEKISNFCNECNKILKNENIDGIQELKLELSFNDKKYKIDVENSFDMRKNKDFYTYSYHGNSYEANFQNIFNNAEHIYKNGIDKKQSIINLFKNYFDYDFYIKYENDVFDTKMSAGKRAILLLKLFIEFDKQNKNPILIDQPEDDLSNKSVCDQLIKYLKDCKKERQIFVVSHNANLVVNCDSEQIIIANRDNKNNFNYISGAIENLDVNGYNNEKKLMKRK